MSRRSFLKQTAALAVAGAFPPPAAPLTFHGAPLVFDEPQCHHIFAFPTWFCIACGLAAEDIVERGL